MAGWTFFLRASQRLHYRTAWLHQRGTSTRIMRSINAEDNWDGSANGDSPNETTTASVINNNKWIESYISKKQPISNPFSDPTSGSSRLSSLSKRDLYDEADLLNIFNLHTELSDTLAGKQQKAPKDGISDDWNPVLHSDVLGPLQSNLNGKDSGSTESSLSGSKSITDGSSWLVENDRAKISQIRAIASDVDGTILTSQHTMHPRTRRAILEAVQRCQSPQHTLEYFFLATGKSQKGALDSLGVEVASQLSHSPGVFLQGLYCLDGHGQIVFERKLTQSAIEAAEQLANQWNVSVIAYDGDSLYTTQKTPVVLELNERYGEPPAQLLDTLTGFSAGFHKILLMDYDVVKINTVVRPQLEELQHEFDATVTQAIPTMLEWLPAGCSKGLGVRKVCEAIGIHPEHQLLAIGDAENDLGMLQMAAIGVAVGNASPAAQDAADFVLEETNDLGGAGVAIELFGFGRALES